MNIDDCLDGGIESNNRSISDNDDDLTNSSFKVVSHSQDPDALDQDEEKKEKMDNYRQQEEEGGDDVFDELAMLCSGQFATK